jgi:hypothetical protein
MDLMTNQRYYWRARGINARGEGPWSTIGQYKTGLSQVLVTSEGQQVCATEGPQVFQWNAVAGASSYRIEIATDANFSTIIKRAAALKASKFTVFDLSPNRSYYWRVQAYNDVSGFVGDWSSIGQISIQPRIRIKGELELCAGSSSTLSLDLVGSQTEVQWYRNGAMIADATSSSYVATEEGVYHAVLYSTDACSEYRTEQIELQAVELPKPEIRSLAMVLCEGESTTLSVQRGAISNISGVSYTWYLNGEVIADGIGSSITVARSGVYIVEAFVNGTCRVSSNIINLVTEAKPVQTRLTIKGSNILCSPLSRTELHADLEEGQDIRWYRDGVLLTGANGFSLEVSQSGTYQGIISNKSCEVATEAVEILSSKITEVSISLHPMFEQQMRLGRATALYATEMRLGITYRWFRDGEEIEGANGRILLATRNGSYVVEVIDERTGCRLSSEAVILSWPAGKEPIRDLMRIATDRDLLNMNAEMSQNWISAWPNPTQGQMTISISAELTEGEVEIQVLDFIGRPIFTGIMEQHGDQLERLIDLSGLRKGLYYIQIRDNRNVYRRTVKRE